MKFLFSFFFVSTLALATPESWTETFVGEGCGQLESAARAEAQKNVTNLADYYRSLCDQQKGTVSMNLFEGTCVEEEGIVGCNVRCSQVGRATCTLPN